MCMYIQVLDYQLWRVIINGSHTPAIKVNSIDVPKSEADWDVHDMKLIE